MPDIISQNLEHNVLEADIERLSKEIAEKRNLPEHKELPERELIKRSLTSLIKNAVQSTELPGKSILPDYLKDLPAETRLQVEQLIDLTFHQGIGKVIQRAKRASPV